MRTSGVAADLAKSGAPIVTSSSTKSANLAGAALTPKTKFQELCYGYPTDLIAQWCCVDVQTARHYKAGTRNPGRQALVLFSLNMRGAILPTSWEGFSFRGDHFFDPYGKELTRGAVMAYPIALQLLREFARGDAARTRAVDDVLHLTPALLATSGAASAAVVEAKPSRPLQSPETIRRRNRQVGRTLPEPLPQTNGPPHAYAANGDHPTPEAVPDP